MSKPVVGQRLWFESRLGSGRDVIVWTVGRKWLTVTSAPEWDSSPVSTPLGRFSVKTMLAEHGNGKLWSSRSAYQYALTVLSDWVELALYMGRTHPPDDMTLERIAEAKATLGGRVRR
ncbi:MAG: hypothetical protein EPN91_02240 [Salinibacterium sp.]|nr:MAG: hypothetical protein EPN91_02240 [Salinibacterium sp.]